MFGKFFYNKVHSDFKIFCYAVLVFFTRYNSRAQTCVCKSGYIPGKPPIPVSYLTYVNIMVKHLRLATNLIQNDYASKLLFNSCFLMRFSDHFRWELFGLFAVQWNLVFKTRHHTCRPTLYYYYKHNINLLKKKWLWLQKC